MATPTWRHFFCDSTTTSKLLSDLEHKLKEYYENNARIILIQLRRIWGSLLRRIWGSLLVWQGPIKSRYTSHYFMIDLWNRGSTLSSLVRSVSSKTITFKGRILWNDMRWFMHMSWKEKIKIILTVCDQYQNGGKKVPLVQWIEFLIPCNKHDVKILIWKTQANISSIHNQNSTSVLWGGTWISRMPITMETLIWWELNGGSIQM